jgi:Fe-S cluster biogenesis protein NfuA
MSVDIGLLERAVEEINVMMASHAGHLVLSSVSEDGRVELRFDAMCAGCPYRPATMAATIRPRLLAVPGVTDVVAAGTRISEHAARRMLDLGLGLVPPRTAAVGES